MTPQQDTGVQTFRGRLIGLLFLRSALLGVAGWGVLLGVVVLSLRAATSLEADTLLWGLASLPLVFGLAIVVAFRSLPTLAQTKALLDRHGRAGGLLMAGEEVETGLWSSRAVDGPTLYWNAGRVSALAVMGLSFLTLAFVVPASFARIGTPKLDVTREAKRLDDQIAVLKEEKILDERRAMELKEKLDQLKKDALARDPVKTLEALDFLHDTTHRTAQEAAESASRKIEELAKAGALAEALEKNGNKLDPTQMGEALNHLAALTKKLESEQILADAGLDQEILDALKQGKGLSKDQMKKLADALKGAKGDLAKKVGRLVKAKLVDADALEKCDKCGECDGAALALYLKENGGDEAAAALLLEIEEAGKGGIDRGPGHAKLNFGEESSDQGIAFKDEALPAGDLKALRDSDLEGISKGTPTVHKGSKAGTVPGGLAGAQAGGGGSTGQMVLPRHRGAVERFFDRQTSPKK